MTFHALPWVCYQVPVGVHLFTFASPPPQRGPPAVALQLDQTIMIASPSPQPRMDV